MMALMNLLKKVLPESLKAPLRRRLHSRRFSMSQAGQDIWVFGEVFDGKRGGYFVDVGANDGVELSNTFVLEARFGWRGLCVEANPDVFVQLRANRRVTCVNACVDGEEATSRFVNNSLFGGIVANDTDNRQSDEAMEVTTVTLQRLLDAAQAPPEIDYLSIDIEGAEERVLRSFPFERYRFVCITVERPGAGLRGVLERAGYVLIKDLPGLDCFYIHSTHLEQYLANVFSFYRRKYIAIDLG